MGFFIFLFVALSLINIIFPRFGWYIRYGWKIKDDNVEPSDAYLLMTRIGSTIVLVLFLIIISSW